MAIRELNLSDLDMSLGRLRVRDRRRESRLLLSMEAHGQQSPILVAAEGGRYVVVDGHKRVRGLMRLKADVAKALVMEMPVEQALVKAYGMGSGSRWSPMEEGWLVSELHRGRGWKLGEVAAALDKSKSWASRRLGLVESLPERVQDLVQKGQLGAHVAMKHLLPLARANSVACERLAEKISGIGLSSRQAALVCAHYGKSGKSTAAARILEDPARFLKALEQARLGKQDMALSEGENRCLRNLELVGSVSWGMVRWLPKAMGCGTGEAAWRKLWQAWERAQAGFRSMEQAIEGLNKAMTGGRDAGSTDAGRDTEAARGGTREPEDSQGPGREPHQRAGGDRERASQCA